MNKENKKIELLTKKGKSFKTPRSYTVTECLFCGEIWDQIKEYLIMFNPRFHFYVYSFAQSIDETDQLQEDYGNDFDDNPQTIRSITFNVFDFSKFNKNSKYHLILTTSQDTTSNNLLINYNSRVEFVDKEINELNLQLGYVYKNILSNHDGERNVLTDDDFNYGLDGITTDNKIMYELNKWKHEIQDKTDYLFLKKFLTRRDQSDKILCVENYLRELLNNKYKIRKTT
jgi:hypothetical protein